jgi:type I restriction enzyme S subunit
MSVRSNGRVLPNDSAELQNDGSELPEGWKTTSLSDLLISLESGSRPRGGVRGIVDGVPSIGGEHLNYDGTFNFESIKYVPHAFAAAMKKGRIHYRDILIVKDGATTGKTAFVGADFPHSEAFVNEHVFICRATEKIDAEFLFRFLMCKDGQERILENFKGSAQGGINQAFASNVQIPLAPLAEQRRIVAKLAALLAQVTTAQQRLSRIPALLKRFRQSVLAAACSGRLTADWREGNLTTETGEMLLARIRQLRISNSTTAKELKQIDDAFTQDLQDVSLQELGMESLPETWETCRIGAVGLVCNGSTPSRQRPEYWGPSTRWVSSGEVRNNCISDTREYVTQSGLAAASLRILPRGTVLIAMIGEGKTRGQSAVLEIEATINQNIAGIILSHGLVDSRFLWRWFQVRYEATREAGSGSGPQALNCQRVRELPFVLPPLAEQQEIVRRVEQLFALADRIDSRLQAAQERVGRLTQSLLAKAFRGELVPTEAELARQEGREYESAEELLARLSAVPEQPATAKKKGRRQG